MRAGLPNACMIAFTGTPIDKKDRSTREVFGDYLHRYLIDQAVKDGATVPIYYEMRDAQLRIDGRDLERDIRTTFPELSDEEIEKLKRGMRLQEKLAGAPVRVEAIAKDILAHYRSTIEPNGFKAQIVTVRREARVSAASALTQLEAMVEQAAGIRSGAGGRGDGLTGTAAAILPFIDAEIPDAERSRSAAGITKALEEYAEVVDWHHKEDVQRQMRRSIKEQLRSLGLEAHKVEATTAKIMDVARARYAG